MVAVLSDYAGQWHDYAELSHNVAWFNMMAYDCHGSWTTHAGHNAPLYAPATDVDGSGHQGILYLRDQRGIPKEKIHLGIPFYGKECNATRLYGPASGWTDLEYAAIAPRRNSGWDYFWDNVCKVPYLLNANRTKFVTFDDSASVAGKCEYAGLNGLGGVMIWALGQDVINNTQPLLEAVGRAMGTGTAVAMTNPVAAHEFFLYGNYPNPFNPSTTITFELERALPVKLSIYNLNGEVVEILQEGLASAGRHEMTWRATGYASGVYFFKLEAGSLRATRKMIFAK